MRRIGRDRALLFGGSVATINFTVISSAQDSYYSIITWTTNVATTSRVDYGTTTGYGASVTSAILTKNHSVLINNGGAGLIQNQLYHYRVGDLSGTHVSADQTFTTVRLRVPQLNFGPFSSLVGAFADTLSNSTGGVVQTTTSSPLVANVNLTAGSLFSDISGGYPNLNIWGDTGSLVCGSAFQATGQAGSDGQFLGNFCCVDIYQGGRGGDGASGGGGGAGESTGNFGPGGDGGLGGSDGGGGVGGCPSSGGGGGFGRGYEYYGLDVIPCGLIPQSGGDGGYAGLCGGSAGGGGGGAGCQINLVLNNLHNSNSGVMFTSGGGGGVGTACNGGLQGAPGSIVLFMRKYDGSLSGYDASQFWIIPILGTFNGGFSAGTPTNDYSSAFDHLYKP